jgi:hypothetical protein
MNPSSICCWGEGKDSRMTRLRKTDSLVALFWIVLGFTISIWSATFPLGTWESIGPAILPLACGVFLVLFGMILLFQAWNCKEKAIEPPVPILPHGPALVRVGLSLGGLVVSAVLFDFLGFNLTMFFLVLFLMKTIQPVGWRVVLFYGLVFTVGSYLFFNVLLKVTLPHGFLGI